ncbi:MAG: preprotein translocase subunit SecE [Alphaproteobacteria bacterium]
MAKINPGQFIREVRQEAGKVTWPTRKETLLTTAMIFMMAFFAALFLFLIDQVLGAGMRFIIGLGS